MEFTPTVEGPHPSGLGGIQKIYHFPNGYGASVIQNYFSYGGKDGLWELGVLRFQNTDAGELTYDTPITDDVLGHLSEAEVAEALHRIAALPPAAGA